MAARGSVRILKTLSFAILAIALVSLLSSSQEGGVGKPELHPTTLILDPASPVDQGRLVNVLAKLENSGGGPSPEFKVEFFIRLRPQGGDVPSWQSFAVVQRRGLSPEEQEVEAQGTLDTANPTLVPTLGIYEVRVVVDSNDQIPEADETNNELIVSLLVQTSRLGKADLRPTSLEFNSDTSPTHPSPFEQTETVLIQAKVVNTGDKDAGPFTVSFSYCGIRDGQTSCATSFTEFATDRLAFSGGLPSGLPNEKTANATLSISQLGLSPGIYLIKVTADPPDADNPTGRIQEQDEANNELTAILSIQGPELHPTGITFNPSLPRLGDTVKVIVTVENSGHGIARNFDVAFFVNGAEFARQTVTVDEESEALVEGFLRTANLKLEVGIQIIQVVVDVTRQISERDETNNEIRTSLTLQTATPRRAELHPKSLILNPRSPIELDANSSLTILSETVNTGEVSARNFEVAFFYRLAGSLRWIPLPCATNCQINELPTGTGIVSEGNLNLVGIAPGKYEVRVLVDPSDALNPEGQVPELDESNNEMKSAMTLLTARKPDLFPDPFSFRLDPASEIRRGTSLNILIDVLNVGEQAAGPFAVEFSLRRLGEEFFTVFARQDVNGLGIGERAPLRARLDTTSIPPGLYELQIVADPDGRIGELNELNNLFTTGPDPRSALFIRGPDLTVLSLQIPQSSSQTGLPTVQPGAQVPLVAQVTNIGVEATGAFDVQFCLQRLGEEPCVPFGQRTSFPGLGIGVVVQATATLDTRSVAQGSYLIQAIVDPTVQGKPFGQVDEENEQNNVGVLPLQIGQGGASTGGGTGGSGSGQADLTALNLSLTPAVAQLGDVVFVQAEVGNIGREDAGRFRVAFFWRRAGEAKTVFFAGTNLSGLAQGARKTVFAELNTSEFFLQGTFEIIVIVDFNEEVRELSESNNRLSQQLIVN